MVTSIDNRPIRVEIATQDILGVRTARDAGADRVELCSALGVGGITPSIGLVRGAIAERIPVHVLVRPRGGGFVYSSADVGVILSDILACVDAGAAGIVVGVLTRNLAMDKVVMKEVVDAAQGVEITFHRAFDITEFPFVVLDQLIDFGVTRVLTSGQEPTVAAGMSNLARYVKHVAGRLQIQAGGGATPKDVAELARIGIRDVHLSAKVLTDEAGPIGPGCGPAEYDATDGTIVAETVRAARASVTSSALV